MSAQRKDSAVVRSYLADEADRIAQIKARSARPDGCGPEIVDVAPARGPVQRFQPREVVLTEAGNVRVTRAGHNGHDAMRRVSALVRMQHRSECRKKGAAPLFTAGQLSIAEIYAALFERLEAAGVRCSSVEAMPGGGGPGCFITALIKDRETLTKMDRKAGSDVVLSPRGALAHMDRGFKVIRVHDLVRGVCVEDMTISQLLQKYGWPKSTLNIKKARLALCAALDRMQGFRDQPTRCG